MEYVTNDELRDALILYAMQEPEKRYTGIELCRGSYLIFYQTDTGREQAYDSMARRILASITEPYSGAFFRTQGEYREKRFWLSEKGKKYGQEIMESTAVEEDDVGDEPEGEPIIEEPEDHMDDVAVTEDDTSAIRDEPSPVHASTQPGKNPLVTLVEMLMSQRADMVKLAALQQQWLQRLEIAILNPMMAAEQRTQQQFAQLNERLESIDARLIEQPHSVSSDVQELTEGLEQVRLLLSTIEKVEPPTSDEDLRELLESVDTLCEDENSMDLLEADIRSSLEGLQNNTTG